MNGTESDVEVLNIELYHFIHYFNEYKHTANVSNKETLILLNQLMGNIEEFIDTSKMISKRSNELSIDPTEFYVARHLCCTFCKNQIPIQGKHSLKHSCRVKKMNRFKTPMSNLTHLTNQLNIINSSETINPKANKKVEIDSQIIYSTKFNDMVVQKNEQIANESVMVSRSNTKIFPLQEASTIKQKYKDEANIAGLSTSNHLFRPEISLLQPSSSINKLDSLASTSFEPIFFVPKSDEVVGFMELREDELATNIIGEENIENTEISHKNVAKNPVNMENKKGKKDKKSKVTTPQTRVFRSKAKNKLVKDVVNMM